MTVIAMTREMATRGSEVALGVAERLGLGIIHHEVVEHDISERSGLPESEVHRFLEGEASLWERWKIDGRRLSRYTALEILELAAKGNVLIRGWGATYLLRFVPHVACLRICAPLAYREKVLMKRLGLTENSAARREIERNDAAHSATMQRLFAIDWQDAALYAIVLNTDRVPVENCVDCIVRMVQSDAFKETPESRAALMDSLVLARVDEALERAFGGRGYRYGFQTEVIGGKLILKGATTDSKIIADALRLVQSVEGVRSVENCVTYVDFVPHNAS